MSAGKTAGMPSTDNESSIRSGDVHAATDRDLHANAGKATQAIEYAKHVNHPEHDFFWHVHGR